MSQLELPNKHTTVRSLFSGLQSVSTALAAQLAAVSMYRTRRRRADGWEQELVAHSQQLALEGPAGRIAARRWGESGPLVLLVHGWNGRGSQLAAFVAPLLAGGHQVIAFDAPGHGESDGSRSSLLAFADAFDAVHDAVRPFFQPLRGVIAHSMGGAAVTFALSRARARGRVGVERGDTEPRLVFVAPPIDLRDFVETVAQQLGLRPAAQQHLQSLVEAHLGKRLEDLHALKVAGSMPEPLLVIHDQQDRAVPFSCGQSLAQAWPRAELLSTQGLGHSRILRDPGVIAAATAFVSGRAD